ncbi:MAG TPA: flavocytochrome c [Parasutterella excrementihominis]|uniref:FAD-dependent oxidoreductase n=2 Tax=Parasutterella excrementihominis TaxID=487175 RepID=UPI000EE8DAFB|nr:flavocytochrome c [Parasutterella excrementihominis]HAI62555.1 flavocytochrome c [Parasutterella excrementihominis]HBZ28065.1 flavocytochrome c [Parasutterella excrementihominis]
MLSRRNLLASMLLSGIPAFASEVKDWDVIVVGTGVAGLAAACSALEAGAGNVLILEKSPVVGGHSILSTGYVAAVDKPRQQRAGIEDSPSLMLQNMLEVGGYLNDVELAKIVCENSEDTVYWLEKMGVKWDGNIYQTVAGLHPRSHITNFVRAGYDYVMALLSSAKRMGAKLALNTKALDLIEKDERVIGIRVQNLDGSITDLFAKAVILATGGFTANVELRSKFDPRLGSEFPTTANPNRKSFDGATGDGLIMAQKLGAATKDAEFLQLIPFWGGRLLDYVGADIYVNNQGFRFVNEAASWRDVSNAILEQDKREMWAITDSQSKKGASLGVKLMNGTVKKASTIKEMAKAMGVPIQNLEETIRSYNKFSAEGMDPIFGKKVFTQQINQPPFYFGKEKLAVHFCCGGIKLNKNAEVVKLDGSIIPGLYVCGEASSGPHGHDRLGGVALTSAFVFGRIAGRNAVTM